MIRAFKNVRQKLLAEARVGKYLKYACGEVVLVVVGIVIALEVNNWNEARRYRVVERDTWVDFTAALRDSRENLHNAIEADERWMSYCKRILEHLDRRAPYDPELDICFGSYFWSSKVELSTAAYEQLKGRGLDRVRNKQLLGGIARIYEYRLRLISAENAQWDWLLLGSVVYRNHVERFRKYFPESWTPTEDEYAKPVDYEALLDDETFKNILAELISLRSFSIATNKQVIGEIDDLIGAIEHEVAGLEG